MSLVLRGRPGQWGDDGAETARMVLDDGVRGLIAPPGGAPSHLAMQVSGRTATPLVSLCADSSVTGPLIPWVVRIVPSTIDEAGAIFAGVKPTAPRPELRWATVVPDGRAGREAARDLRTAATNAGCVLQSPIEVSLKATDFEAVADNLLRTHPDAILLWLEAEPAVRLSQALRKAGFTGRLAGPGRLRDEPGWSAAGAAAEGWIAPAIVRDEASEAKFHEFAAAYRVHFKEEPDPTAAYAYDAARLLIDILGRSDSQMPRRPFPGEPGVAGASGRLQFDRQGNRILHLHLLVCRNGTFKKL